MLKEIQTSGGRKRLCQSHCLSAWNKAIGRGLSLALCIMLLVRFAAAEDLPINGLAGVGLRVSDVEKSHAYYAGWLGLEAPPAEPGSSTYFKLNDDQYLELIPGLKAGEPERRVYVAFLATDLKKVSQMLESRGLQREAISNNAMGDAEFSLRAPEGTLLKFVQPQSGGLRMRTRGRYLGPRRISTRLLHTGLNVSALDASMTFYRDQLGFKEFWRGGPTENELRWVMLRMPGVRGDYIELILHTAPPARQQLGAMQHISLEVPDAAAAHRELVSRGAPDDPKRKPLLGVDRHWLYNLMDPDGTRTEFMETRTIPAGQK
jgi:lactoylglutathione lyase